jgi:ligand-binding sensor domain-containing protein
MPTEADSFMIKHGIVSIVKLNNNNLVLAANDAGAVVMSPSGKLLHEINQTKIRLQNDAIRKMFTNRQNATWFAMNKDISRIKLKNPINFWSEANSGLKGTIEAIIRHKGTLYITTHTGIFYINDVQLNL